MSINDMETPGYDPIGAARDEAWKALPSILAKVAAERPGKGRRVTVLRGKHKGRAGVVFWHGRRPGAPPDHSDPMMAAVYEARGIGGYRVGIRTDAGEKIFVDANNVQVEAAA